MTIRTKEAEVPSFFPPARLFLDDIEEIVRILLDATENRKENWIVPGQDAKTTVTLTAKDQVCDEVQELRRIAIKTINLSVSVEVQKALPRTVLTFNRYSTYLYSVGFTREQQLSLYHNLAAIFKRRNRWLATLARSHRLLILSLIYLLILANIAITFTPKKPIPLSLDLVIGLLGFAIATTFLWASWHHSIIILRHSSERDDIRQDLLRKNLPLAISVVLTFLLTLLGMYLKRKWWP